MIDPTTCIHRESGLCPDCCQAYEEDPEAWYEFGDHTDGIARSKAQDEEIRREYDQTMSDSIDRTDIPF